MNAIEQLKLFLQTAPQADDKRYTFELPCSEGKAKDYIHRMRVELARLRRKLRDQGNQIRRFKMLTVSCDAIPGTDTTMIVLQYKDSAVNGLSQELNAIFTVVASEEQIIDESAVRDVPKPTGLNLNVKAT